MFGLHEDLRALEAAGTPIRVALIGAGAAGLPFADQVERAPGMKTCLAIDLNPERAADCLRKVGIPENEISLCSTLDDVEKALAQGLRVATNVLETAWRAPDVDVVVEATGNPTVYAKSAMRSIQAGRHYVTFNAEGDACVGHILRSLADSAGVVYTGIYGEESGIIKALFDEVTALGFEVVAAGRSDYAGGLPSWHRDNIGPFLKECRMGDVQHNLSMFASFCDGTKTNEELCQVANATGLMPDVRGMHGPVVPFEEFTYRLPQVMDLRENGGILNRIGVVERVLPSDKPEDNPVWCFVVARATNDFHKIFMGNYGAGALGHPRTAEVLTADHRNVLFYTPYHYVSAQAPITVAYAALYNRPVLAPLREGRAADVVALARTDLDAGTILDEIGGLTTYGRIDTARVVREERLLPLAMARGAVLKRPVQQGEAISLDAVILAEEESLIRTLRDLQNEVFDVL